jgi:type IV fimbrial biogenesis protein FimT
MSGPLLNRLQRGVTLIELAVVMAIVAILLSQAGPLFSAWTQNVQIRTATESIQNGLQLARAEAIRRNRSVMFWLTSTATPKTADWLVGCANPFMQNGNGTQPETPGDCPGSQSTAGAPQAFNWIQYQTAASQQTTLPQVTAVDANNNPTTVVAFNSLGMVVAANPDGTTPIAQISVSIPSMPASVARPLQVRISAGQIRMCDPNLSLATDPRGCQ